MNTDIDVIIHPVTLVNESGFFRYFKTDRLAHALYVVGFIAYPDGGLLIAPVKGASDEYDAYAELNDRITPIDPPGDGVSTETMTYNTVVFRHGYTASRGLLYLASDPSNRILELRKKRANLVQELISTNASIE